MTELITNRSALLVSASTSSRKPASTHVLLEAEVADLPLERRAQLAFAEDHQLRVGHLAAHQRHRVDQELLALVAARARRR